MIYEAIMSVDHCKATNIVTRVVDFESILIQNSLLDGPLGLKWNESKLLCESHVCYETVAVMCVSSHPWELKLREFPISYLLQ